MANRDHSEGITISGGGLYSLATIGAKHVIDVATPLVDTDDAVYRAGLRLDHIDTRIVKCPFAESFREHGDAARFA
jgi:hypothetical protein